jgi:starvation-inducible DNA-binding protein
MKTDIGISIKKLKKSTDVLTVLLSNETVLYIKTRKFHWNVKGDSFMELHRLFQDQYTELEGIIDAVAERIGKLGENTPGTMKEYLDKAIIEESPELYPTQKEMLAELLSDHEKLIRQIRKEIEALSEQASDVGSIDFITGIIEDHESIAWVLRRFLH